MAYKRKTMDEWRLYLNYGQGWEEVCAESTRAGIIQRRNEYRDNCPEYPRRWCKVRIPTDAYTNA